MTTGTITERYSSAHKAWSKTEKIVVAVIALIALDAVFLAAGVTAFEKLYLTSGEHLRLGLVFSAGGLETVQIESSFDHVSDERQERAQQVVRDLVRRHIQDAQQPSKNDQTPSHGEP
jgi:hypothetical protein